jgi:hypothetical protein
VLVDALQVSDTVLLPPVACRLLGAAGGVHGPTTVADAELEFTDSQLGMALTYAETT